jgi:hypothetical protein
MMLLVISLSSRKENLQKENKIDLKVGRQAGWKGLNPMQNL